MVHIECEHLWNVIKRKEGRVYSDMFLALLSKRLSLAIAK